MKKDLDFLLDDLLRQLEPSFQVGRRYRSFFRRAAGFLTPHAEREVACECRGQAASRGENGAALDVRSYATFLTHVVPAKRERLLAGRTLGCLHQVLHLKPAEKITNSYKNATS